MKTVNFGNNHSLSIPNEASFGGEILIQNYKITPLGFVNRFTDEEAIALDLASIDNPNGTQEERINAAKIRRFLDKVNKATHIDLSLQETIDGVNQLVAFGFLTEQRATEILTSPVQDFEVYRGF